MARPAGERVRPHGGVTAMTAWTKSSYSGTGDHSDCVEVQLTPQVTA
ncbi:DUF397 domain-containing protein, partial [Amycolatopsis sp.]